jgi:adenosylcobinamide-phosphate synthase
LVNYVISSTIALCAGFALDAVLGDPQGWPHLVRAFGALISALERLLYPLNNKRVGGAILAAAVLVICTAIPALLLWAAWTLSPWAYMTLEALLCWQCIAVKSLKSESRRVYTALERGDLEGARYAVSRIVGRDTDALDSAGVTRAAVETIAENTSDGVAAPLMFMAIGGAALGCFYKAANTMDSMIGYKNERYLDFGRFAARLDDALNFLPSRLCAMLMIAAAGILGLDSGNAARIRRRDRRNHASPNSAQTESVVAGALRVQLAGSASYFGKTLEKPYIGDAMRPVEPRDILRAHAMLTLAAIQMLALAVLIRGAYYVIATL